MCIFTVNFGGQFPIKEVDDIIYEVDCQITKIRPNVHAEETKFDKKEYMTHLKNYLNSIKNHLSTTNPDRVQAFQKASAEYAKKIAPNWRSLWYFTGASLDPNGMVVLSGYREDGVTQYFIFWKDGLRTINR
ncbi:translationally-controlled tumor protein [Aspergillus arachidicola]|uniref:Translationally-controlled tumor protein homolog n=1 Tax=Aspergillus arachidicola TaxID=656916 RepID=A0A5N6YGF1_9EURO|nr:translationally-controlled tumor protein [Aspergillus arachidicola]